MRKTVSIEAAEALIGQETGKSEWLEIDQSRIDKFADATNDHQFIHINPEAAATTPFGGTIAHGFLTLSMLTDLAAANSVKIENTAMVINYGLNKVRFLNPVKAGDEIRACVVLVGVDEKREKQYLLTTSVTVEIKGQESPALVAEWLTMTIAN